MKEELVLTVDATVNLALGVLLAIFPRAFAGLVGAPIPSTSFYASILGGVLIGVGLALLLQRFWGRSHVTGLGIEGAIAINLCGGGVLVVWLITGGLSVATRGLVFLWVVAILVLGIGATEILLRVRRKRYQSH
jgi:hypothetical protein